MNTCAELPKMKYTFSFYVALEAATMWDETGDPNAYFKERFKVYQHLYDDGAM